MEGVLVDSNSGTLVAAREDRIGVVRGVGRVRGEHRREEGIREARGQRSGSWVR